MMKGHPENGCTDLRTAGDDRTRPARGRVRRRVGCVGRGGGTPRGSGTGVLLPPAEVSPNRFRCRSQTPRTPAPLTAPLFSGLCLWGGGFGWDPPPPRVPLWYPPKAGRKIRSFNPLGTEGIEAEILAVSLKHWKGRRGGGGSRGGWGTPLLLRCMAVLIIPGGGGGRGIEGEGARSRANPGLSPQTPHALVRHTGTDTPQRTLRQGNEVREWRRGSWGQRSERPWHGAAPKTSLGGPVCVHLLALHPPLTLGQDRPQLRFDAREVRLDDLPMGIGGGDDEAEGRGWGWGLGQGCGRRGGPRDSHRHNFRCGEGPAAAARAQSSPLCDIPSGRCFFTGQSPALPFACCVGSLLSVGRCGRCSCWCRFRVRGAQ